MKTLKVPRESSLLDTAAASVSGDVTDVMGSDCLRAPAELGETVKSVTIRWTDGTEAVLDAMAKNTTHAIQKDG